ncbi:MAG: ectoine/hydroxyectoine ABC transporter permease subunit EhuD [Acidobacteriota bacterium]|nr:ectoine/hydroxyectoine ABC transporter permease subunit EhuD [Acidobacteriota bacterium]
MNTTIFDWAFAWEILPALFRALGVTVLATVLGMAIALPLGLLWTILRRGNRWVAGPVDLAVDFIRSTPLLIQIYFLFYALPKIGPAFSPLLTGVVALGLHYSSYTAEVYRAGIDGVARGQWEAAKSLGFSRWQTWRKVILPQALPPVVPALGNYLIAMFKDSPMLAAITVAELLQTARVIGAEQFRYLEPMTLVAMLFLLVSVLSSRLVGWVENRLVVRHA